MYLLVVSGKYLIAKKVAISVTWNYRCRSWSTTSKKLVFCNIRSNFQRQPNPYHKFLLTEIEKYKKGNIKTYFLFYSFFFFLETWAVTFNWLYSVAPLKSSQEMRISQWAASSGQWYKTILQKPKIVSCISFMLSVKPKIISEIKMLHKYTKYPGGPHLLYWPKSVFSLVVNLWKVVRSVVNVRRSQICHWNLAFEYYNTMETAQHWFGESRIIILGTKCFASSKPCTKQEPPQHPCEVGQYYYPYLTNGKPYTERLNDLLKTTVNQQQGWDKNSSPALLPSQCQ